MGRCTQHVSYTSKYTSQAVLKLSIAILYCNIANTHCNIAILQYTYTRDVYLGMSLVHGSGCTVCESAGEFEDVVNLQSLNRPP